MLTRGEWVQHADTAAAQEWGRRHPNMFALRRGIVPGGALIGLGMLGFGVYWLWHHIGGAFDRPSASGLPAAFWVIAAVAMIGSVVALRPRGGPTMMSVLIVKVFFVVLVWLGLIVYAIGYLA